MTGQSPTNADPSESQRWQPLEAVDRRVLGVLIEKAKTTPDAYPLTLNALRTGCNQKSNRFPQMQLEEDAMEESLERLRGLGAVAFVQGASRVGKYRHLAYEWLDVDKVQIAVMAELLLRGAQTVGELRGRAARMEPIKGLDELRPIVDSLVHKRLIIYLTSPGRGAVVTHTLYLDRELDKIRREHGGGAPNESPHPSAVSGSTMRQPIGPAAHSAPARASQVPAPPVSTQHSASRQLDQEVGHLRREIATLRSELQAAQSELETSLESLRRDLDDLNRQLGN